MESLSQKNLFGHNEIFDILKNLYLNKKFPNKIILSGTLILLIWVLEPTSSITSIALSGKYLSVIYLSLNSTHALIAKLVILTLWWSSYFDLIPFKISIVSLIDGGLTIIFWNLLSYLLALYILLQYF